MCFRNSEIKEVDANELRMAEEFLAVRSVKALVMIYPSVMSELGRSFTRGELVSAILEKYDPDEVLKQYAYALIAQNGRIMPL